MAQRTATGSGVTNNNSGVAMGIGSNATGPLTDLSIASSSVVGSKILNTIAFPTNLNGTGSVFKTASVTITSVADNSGKCRFTLNSHGLSVGNVLFISGSTSGNVDGTHTITAVTTNTFDTDVTYVASATAGVYKMVARNFASMEENEYVVKLVGTKIAGTADSNVTTPNGYRGSVKALKYARGTRRLDITSWDAVTGAATYGANKGVLATYRDKAGNTLEHEALPTNAVPGQLVYHYGTNPPKDDQYKARTSP